MGTFLSDERFVTGAVGVGIGCRPLDGDGERLGFSGDLGDPSWSGC
jgi:hypothetical protein